MKKIIFICLFFIISGCSVFQPEETIFIQPKIIRQAELPPLRFNTYGNCFEFFCEMSINCCGDVERAKLLTSSGDAAWDSLAQISLLKWKYTPAIYEGHPIKLCVRRKIRVVFEEPRVLSLAEIEVQNYAKADSVYNALLQGSDFTTLCLHCSISKSKERNGVLGSINIKHFNDDIRVELANLDEGEFTKPLAYGDHYVIYKRLKLNN